MAQHAVILTPEEYERLKAGDKIANKVLGHKRADREEQEAVAAAFMAQYDPERFGGGWGHVSFCFTQALEALLMRS